MSKQISITVPDHLFEELEKARGEKARNAFIRAAIEASLGKEERPYQVTSINPDVPLDLRGMVQQPPPGLGLIRASEMEHEHIWEFDDNYGEMRCVTCNESKE